MQLSEDLTPLVLFEDQNVIVLSKPAGLLSQGEKKGDPNLVDWLRQRFGRNYVGLVHRLDRNTSGIMVVAKRSKAAERLTWALQEGKIYRSYLAWVSGKLKSEATWKHRLFKDEKKNQVRVVSPTHPQGKDAVLKVKPIRSATWRGQPITLAEFTLETGRSHQIRVQAAQEGHPLLGDRKYSTKDSVQDGYQFGRPALHSSKLSFPHPITGAYLDFEAQLPQDMAGI